MSRILLIAAWAWSILCWCTPAGAQIDLGPTLFRSGSRPAVVSGRPIQVGSPVQVGSPIEMAEPLPIEAGAPVVCESCGGPMEYVPGVPYDASPLFGPGFVLPDNLPDLYLFAGVHGFKGAADLGRNGNFGFHEGVNLSGPLGDPWGFGFQAGVQAVHSNFKGNQTLTAEDGSPEFDDSTRNQVFFTGGFFHRKLGGGLQGGTVFDYFYDSYFRSSSLGQIRTEWSLVGPSLGEIGFWGAFGVTKDLVSGRLNAQTPLEWWLAPKDMYSAFIRRYFSGGGQGRIWAGMTGGADILFGAELSVPLGTSWALENNFTFLLPRDSASSGGQSDESWAVGIQLVWYPGRSAYGVRQSPFYPLFNVADNSVFLVDRR